MDTTAAPFALDRESLSGPVRRALGNDGVEVVAWDCRSIHRAFNPVTGGLYRVTGSAREPDTVTPWSLVLKVVCDPAATRRSGDLAASDPMSPHAWRREPLLYQSGLLDRMSGALVAPRCFGVAEPAPGVAWIWLEDVLDDAGSQWTPQDYGVVARHLGAFNGAYLTRQPLPTDSFLSRGFQRGHVAQTESFVARLPNLYELPLVRVFWPRTLMDRIWRLWQGRDRMLTILDRLPQTFCHLDAFRKNLLTRRRPEGGEQTVAVDWSFSGIAAIGEELAPLVTASVLFGGADPAALRDLDGWAFDGYLQGLKDAGWQGDVRLVRRGAALAAFLRFSLVLPWGAALSERFRQNLEQSERIHVAGYLDRSARVADWLCDRVEEQAEHFNLVEDDDTYRAAAAQPPRANAGASYPFATAASISSSSSPAP